MLKALAEAKLNHVEHIMAVSSRYCRDMITKRRIKMIKLSVNEPVIIVSSYKALGAVCAEHTMKKVSRLIQRDVNRIDKIIKANIEEFRQFKNMKYLDPFETCNPVKEQTRKQCCKALLKNRFRPLLKMRLRSLCYNIERPRCYCGSTSKQLAHVMNECAWFEDWVL